MPLNDILTADAVFPALPSANKKQVLQELAAHAARLTGRAEREIFEVLLQRERLGSTGIGNGVAIPHGKLPRLERLLALFARLQKPIEFESLDGQPVDLVVLLLAPEGAGADHLKALARIARMLRDPATAARLRANSDAAEIYRILTSEAAAISA
jgi:PTS system nitrogen regulatory IIA component